MNEIETFADKIFDAVKGYVSRGLDGLHGRLSILEQRVANLSMPVDGKDGAAGRDGVDGKDGKDGAPGERGAPGIDGKEGAPGKDGVMGWAGEDGAAGKDGAAGADGTPGRDGRDGKAGPPGRDALQLEILDGIDPTRSYARGTYASYDGGLIRAAQTTEPFEAGAIEAAGWQVIVRGIAEFLSVLEADGRTAKFKTRLTGGKEIVQEFRLATMLDAGVYRAEVAYAKGDVVTRDGSMFIAQTDAPSGIPGASADWRLSVKRGQNGKDGKDGKDGRGERGEAGRPGMDLTHIGVGGEKY